MGGWTGFWRSCGPLASQFCASCRLSDAQLERTHPGDSAAGVPLQHNALLVGLEPLDLPNLRPTSAEGSRLQHSCPSSCLRSSQGGASFLSPPLHAVLQSPVPRAATGPGGCALLMCILMGHGCLAACD